MPTLPPRPWRSLFLLGALLVPGQVGAQGVTTASSCTGAPSALGPLGILEVSCDCTFDSRNGTWTFRGEPEIRAVAPGGPSAGRLRPGDIVVAVDGIPITTRAAGTRLSRYTTTPLTLRVRRGNREIEVRITPEEPCQPPVPPRPASAAPPRAVSAPRLPGAGTPPVTPQPPSAVRAPPAPPTSGGWFGFGISCTNCEMNVTNHADIERAEFELRALLDRPNGDASAILSARAKVRDLRRANTSWRFSEYPSLFSVDRGSPALEAGLQRGDVLLKIDGHSLLTAEGARRFALVEPGQTVGFTYRRGGSEHSVNVQAVERPYSSFVAAPVGRATETLGRLERIEMLRERELEEHAARLTETLDRAEGSARGGRDRERALAELRAQTEALSTTQTSESQVQLERLRSQLALLERSRPLALESSPEEQHLRFAGSVGNTEVEVRGRSSVVVSYDRGTGELLISTLDSTIRVKAPAQR